MFQESGYPLCRRCVNNMFTGSKVLFLRKDNNHNLASLVPTTGDASKMLSILLDMNRIFLTNSQFIIVD
jgi:hypothetical protein